MGVHAGQGALEVVVLGASDEIVVWISEGNVLVGSVACEASDETVVIEDKMMVVSVVLGLQAPP